MSHKDFCYILNIIVLVIDYILLIYYIFKGGEKSAKFINDYEKQFLRPACDFSLALNVFQSEV